MSGGQQRHESVSTTTVDLNRQNKHDDTSNRRSRHGPEISFDQLIDAINFSNVDRAAAQDRDLTLALNMYSLPANHRWTDSNQHQLSRNLFYTNPTAREIGNVKRSSGSGHSGPPSSQQQPIRDVQSDRNPLTNYSRTPQVTSSSTRNPTQGSSRTCSRLFDIESAIPTSSASLYNASTAQSPRFAEISSGIKRKSSAPKNRTEEPRENQVACSQQPKLTSTDLFLMSSAAAPSSAQEDANIRMVVSSLSGMIDGITKASWDASRHLQVGWFYF